MGLRVVQSYYVSEMRMRLVREGLARRRRKVLKASLLIVLLVGSLALGAWVF